MIRREAGQPTLRPCVGPVELGPRFLKNRNPELTVATRSERTGSVPLAGQVIVNDHRLLIPIDEHLHHVDASRIYLLRHKHGPYPVLKLC